MISGDDLSLGEVLCVVQELANHNVCSTLEGHFPMVLMVTLACIYTYYLGGGDL